MILIELEGLPISVNKAYQTIHKKKGRRTIPMRTLTQEGRAYKRLTTATLASRYSSSLATIQKDHPYGLAVQLRLNNLKNSGWPQKAKTRYKKLDASNRLKLLEDAIADACGIDDSQFLTVIVDKEECSENEPEGTKVWIWDEEEEPDAALIVIARIRDLQ